MSYTNAIAFLISIETFPNCIDAPKAITVGEKYFFICPNPGFKPNPVFYGNIGLGLFPHTKEVKKRIKKVS
jgi:hypothetical protein